MSKKLIPVTAENSPSGELCGSCPASCCVKGTQMEMYAREASRVARAGGKITQLVAPKPFTRRESFPLGIVVDDKTGQAYQVLGPPQIVRSGRGVWLFEADCPFLVHTDDGGSYCGDYDNRMEICHEFQEGGYLCERMRKNKGIDDSGLREQFDAIQERELAEISTEVADFELEEAEDRAKEAENILISLLSSPTPRKPAPTSRTGGNPRGKNRRKR